MFDERVIASIASALIGAIVVAVGWLVTAHRERAAYRRDAEKERRASLRLRIERMEDVQRALKAEIMTHIAQLARNDLSAFAAKMIGRMESDENFIPFVPREKHDAIFEALLPDIHILGTEIVLPVTFYYAHTISLSMMVEDLRSDGFKQLSSERRIAMFRHYMSMLQVAEESGMNALEALDLEDDERAWLTSLSRNSGPDHSDPETGA
ncbi:hypothetical protein ACMA5I_09785 [Paracoccaceae bacterium GXU_MW_L88]